MFVRRVYRGRRGGGEQGPILGRALFTLFMNDLVYGIEKKKNLYQIYYRS